MKIWFTAARPESYTCFFYKCQKNFQKDVFLTTRMSYTRYRKILLIKKHTCQTFTNEKHWAYNQGKMKVKAQRSRENCA